MHSAQADCFDKCNATYTSCQNNPVIDKEYCEMGMENCVLKCFNQSNANQTEVWASNCTDKIPYLKFLDRETASQEMTDCMDKAFKQKITSWWSPGLCSYECDDASTLCNYTQYIDYNRCKNRTDSCYIDCFNYDFDNHTNNTNCTWQTVCTEYYWGGQCANYQQLYICNGNYSYCYWQQQCMEMNQYWGCMNYNWEYQCPGNTTNCSWVEDCHSYSWNGTCQNFTYKWDCNKHNDTNTTSNCTWQYECVSWYYGQCMEYDWIQNCTNCTYYDQCSWWQNGTCQYWDRYANCTTTPPLNCSSVWSCINYTYNGNCSYWDYMYNCSEPYNPPQPVQNCSWENVCTSFDWRGYCTNTTWEYICNGNYSNCSYREHCNSWDYYGNCNSSYWNYECGNYTNNTCAWVNVCESWYYNGTCAHTTQFWDCNDKNSSWTNSNCSYNYVCDAYFNSNCRHSSYIENCTNITYSYQCVDWYWQNNSCVVYNLNENVTQSPALNCTNMYDCGSWDWYGNCTQYGWWYNCSEPYIPPAQNCSWENVCEYYFWNNTCYTYKYQYICNGNYSNCSYREHCNSWDYYGNCNSSYWDYECGNQTNNTCAFVVQCNMWDMYGNCVNNQTHWDCGSDKNASWTNSDCHNDYICTSYLEGMCYDHQYYLNCTNTTFSYVCISWNWNNNTCGTYYLQETKNYSAPLNCSNQYGCVTFDYLGNCLRYGWWYNCSLPAPPQKCEWENVCTSYDWRGNCTNYTWEYICNGNYSNCSYKEHCNSWDYYGNCNSSYWNYECGSNNNTNNSCAYTKFCSNGYTSNGSCSGYSYIEWNCDDKDQNSTDSSCYGSNVCVDSFNGICSRSEYINNCTNTTRYFQCVEWNSYNNTCQLYERRQFQTQTGQLNCTFAYGCGSWDIYGNCNQYGYWNNCTQPTPVQNCNWENVCTSYDWRGNCTNYTWEYICNGNYSNCSYREHCNSWDYYGNCNSSYWNYECGFNYTNNSCANTRVCSFYTSSGYCAGNTYNEWNCEDKNSNYTDSNCYETTMCVDSFNGICSRSEYIRNCTNTTHYFQCIEWNSYNGSCQLYEKQQSQFYDPPLNCTSTYDCGKWDIYGNCAQYGYWYNCTYAKPIVNCNWENICTAFDWRGNCTNYTWEYICDGNYSNCTYREQCYSWDYYGNCNSSNWIYDCGNHNQTNNTCNWVQQCTNWWPWGSCQNYSTYWDCNAKDQTYTDNYCYQNYLCLADFNYNCRKYDYVSNCTNTTWWYTCIQWNNTNNTCALYQRQNSTSYSDPLNCSTSYECGSWNWNGQCQEYGYWHNCSLPQPYQNCSWEWVCDAFYLNGSCQHHSNQYICNGNYSNCTNNEKCVKHDQWGNCLDYYWFDTCNNTMNCTWHKNCGPYDWNGTCSNYTWDYVCEPWNNNTNGTNCTNDYRCVSWLNGTCQQYRVVENCTTCGNVSYCSWSQNGTCLQWNTYYSCNYTAPLNCTNEYACTHWDYYGNCINYGWWYNCTDPSPNPWCKNEQVCNYFDFKGGCWGSTTQEICGGNFSGVCSGRQVCYGLDSYGQCNYYDWSGYSCVNQSASCATVRQNISNNGSANYTYTWDCEDKWYHENRTCGYDYPCLSSFNGLCKHSEAVYNCTNTSWSYQFAGSFPNSTGSLYDKFVSSNSSAPLTCNKSYECGDWNWQGKCNAYGYWINCTYPGMKNDTGNDTDCGKVLACSWRDRNGTCQSWYNTTRCGLNDYHFNSSCDYNEVCTATFASQYCARSEYLYNCTNSTTNYYCIDYNATGCARYFENVTYQFTPLACNSSYGCGNWTNNGVCQNWGEWVNCSAGSPPEPHRCDQNYQCIQWSMNGSCSNYSFVQNCTQPQNDGCNWDERCVAWYYGNCSQVTYFQNCLSNATRPIVKSKISKARAFQLNGGVNTQQQQVTGGRPECRQCYNMGLRVKSLIEQYNCSFIFETYMQTLAEEYFFGEGVSTHVASKFADNCAHFREHLDTYTPEYACGRTGVC